MNHLIISTNEKSFNLQPSRNLGQLDICSYKIDVGLDNESPVVDEFILLRAIQMQDVTVDVGIAENIEQNFIDMCVMYEGDTIFARYPFKLFLSTQGIKSNANFFFEVTYASEHDLSQTMNSRRCSRRQNGPIYETDDFKGSTINGEDGYGYPSKEAESPSEEQSTNEFEESRVFSLDFQEKRNLYPKSEYLQLSWSLYQGQSGSDGNVGLIIMGAIFMIILIGIQTSRFGQLMDQKRSAEQ
mmetsp:Transcript_13739/g.23433  ORF Transcript_13739/g.23433 Transcript_13739/m.23433 type:complete len:242 (-) Transcript_13739:208-933(-)